MQTICLSWIDPATAEHHRDVFGLPLTIGRAAGCDIVFNDPQISRQHATLQKEHEQIVISDMQSRNGTFVDGKRVGRAALADGTAIQIGSVQLIVELDRATRVVGGFGGRVCSPQHKVLTKAALRQPITGDQVFSIVPLLERELASSVSPQRMHRPTQDDPAIVPIGWGKGCIIAIAWSPEGRFLAVASTLGIYLYNAQTLDERHFLPTAAPVEQILFVEQNSILVAISKRAIHKWRVQDGMPLDMASALPPIVVSAVCAPNGETLLLDMGQQLHLYHASSSQLLQTLPVDVTNLQYGVAFTIDGQILAAAIEGGIQLWNVCQGYLLRTLKVNNLGLMSLAISPDGQILAGAFDTTIRVWHIQRGELLYSIELNNTTISRIAFAPDSRSIAAITDGAVRVWRMIDGVPLRTLRVYATNLVDIAFATDSGVLAVASTETVHIWRIRDGALLHRLEGYLDRVRSITFAPNSRIFATTSGAVRLWHIVDDTLVLSDTLSEHAAGANSVAFAPDGELLATASSEQIDIWRVYDGMHTQTLPAQSIQAGSVIFLQDGQSLFTVAPEAVERWHIDGSETCQIRPKGMEKIYDVAFASHGQAMATVSSEKVQLWQIADGNLLFELKVGMNVTCIALDPDGQLLAVSSDAVIQVWQPYQHEHCYTLEEGAQYLVFSADGALFASVKGKVISLWRASNGVLLQTLCGHTASVTCLAFAPCGQFLVSGSQDGTIRLWKW